MGAKQVAVLPGANVSKLDGYVDQDVHVTKEQSVKTKVRVKVNTLIALHACEPVQTCTCILYHTIGSSTAAIDKEEEICDTDFDSQDDHE